MAFIVRYANAKVFIDVERIISAVCETRPEIASEIDGDLSCYWCSGALYPDEAIRLDRHEDDCIWRLALATRLALDSVVVE